MCIRDRFIGGHPRLFAGNRSQTVTLDSAITNESELKERLEALLSGKVHRMKVKRVNLVNDTTVVDVRYSLSDQHASPPQVAAQTQAPAVTGNSQ